MPSQIPPLTEMNEYQQYRISDIYFYSELLKSVGSKQSDEWLQTSVLRHPKLASVPSTSVSSVNSSCCMSCTSDCPTSPQSAVRCRDRSNLVSNMLDVFESARNEKSADATLLRTLSCPDTDRTAILQNDHQHFFRKQSKLGSENFQQSAKDGKERKDLNASKASFRVADSVFLSKLGLLFTDAAHFVLEDSDADFVMQQLNSTLPPVQPSKKLVAEWNLRLTVLILDWPSRLKRAWLLSASECLVSRWPSAIARVPKKVPRDLTLWSACNSNVTTKILWIHRILST